MAELDYPIYDTMVWGTTANTKHTLFQSGQGSGGGNGEQLTNMRGSGQFPDKEDFTVSRIGVHVNNVTLTADDIAGLFVNSILTINYNNVKILQAPLYNFSDKNAVQGTYSEASASDFNYFGQLGEGYKLSKPFTIRGGKSFNIEVLQGLALDAVSQNILVTMFGMLNTPDITV